MAVLRPVWSRHRSATVTVLIAFILGILVDRTVFKSTSHNPRKDDWTSLMNDPQGHHNNEESSDGIAQEIDAEAHKEHEDENKGELFRRIRVLCWVMTNPSNHMSKARHVLATWGRRCNHFVFMSSQPGLQELPGVVKLNVSEGRDHLWEKTREAFTYLYRTYGNIADWFLKADDDTYVIVENLRFLLKDKNPNDPVYFGCRFKPFIKQGYMSGGAGYVLSKVALRRLVSLGLSNSTLCRSDGGGAEDVEIGKCLAYVGVKAGDSRDALGRGRFFPLTPETHLIPGSLGKDHWFWSWIYYPSESGLKGVSDSAISFHYVSPAQMYVMEYLIYHLRPYPE